VDPDSESGSRKAKMAHKNRKQLINFIAGRSLLRAEGFSYSLEILYGGPGISLSKKGKKISAVNFIHFWSSKPWIQIWL
jgi:hypothetical protein